jgi:hypothetical protein
MVPRFDALLFGRRTRVYALAVLLMGSAQVVAAKVNSIGSTATSMTSTTKRMVSYRNQQHSWQTSDGAIHIMINRGTVPTGDSLTLYSSFDLGATWTQMFTLANSNGFSTSDGMLLQNTANGTVLQIVYGTEPTTGYIMYAAATYDGVAQSWTLSTTQTAFAAPGYVGSTPAFSLDSDGNLWCEFTAENRRTQQYQIQMLYQAANTTTWTNTGMVFGVTDSSTQHAGRPVPLSNGVGMVYQVDQSMYWAYRLSGWTISTPWVTSDLYDGLPPQSSDPFDTHFSVIADPADNLFLGFSGNSQLQYMKYTSATSTWTLPQPLTSASATATYMQVTIAGGNVMLLVNYKTSIEVFQSTDNGNTFNLTQALVHTPPPPGSTLDYSNPRVESPSYALSPVPVWQQFFDGPTQMLMFFPVPVLH